MCEINKKLVLTSMDEEDIVTSMNLACESKQKASNIVKPQMEWLTLIDKKRAGGFISGHLLFSNNIAWNI